ncbi:hypothetical protein [Dyella caseinilytica]|uniref:Uncharacterized protein n=1 Tax=Dyella caseinilytica TaxID=1849581 RepID=A0ABX7GZK8_9GAMM|nr:hypothetical protein [Dyella caseinilytica]QRN55368.1 hypothetical protein ISN74_08615 [Dyella caseinilytica]GGA01217.1 hypothetical protein GCM10011408_23040 [Dyella caseinilytica]
MRRYCLCIAIAMLGWSSTGMATEAFGIVLHRPLVTQECLKRQDAYLSDDHEQCYKWPDGAAVSNTLPRDGQIIVNIPLQDRPGYMSGSDVMVGLKDGLVVSLSVRTHRGEENLHDYRALVDEFGEPPGAASQQAALPNEFHSLLANWTLPDGATVYYNSTEWNAVAGLVRVQWPTANAHQSGAWD